MAWRHFSVSGCLPAYSGLSVKTYIRHVALLPLPCVCTYWFCCRDELICPPLWRHSLHYLLCGTTSFSTTSTDTISCVPCSILLYCHSVSNAGSTLSCVYILCCSLLSLFHTLCLVCTRLLLTHSHITSSAFVDLYYHHSRHRTTVSGRGADDRSRALG